jgi:hypothetical protein
MPALPPYIIEPICQQFLALLPPTEETNHPLGCRHRSRVADQIVFEKLVSGPGLRLRLPQDRRVEECSATTLRRRPDEWIEAGAMEALEEEEEEEEEELALESY